LEQVILKTPSEAAIRQVARSHGMLTMKEDAIIKALRREIPWEEVDKL
jgi:type II secretory ATPase GspE/PulE/Tfp pilus assembly ATPase PilB-like protein